MSESARGSTVNVQLTANGVILKQNKLTKFQLWFKFNYNVNVRRLMLGALKIAHDGIKGGKDDKKHL